LAKKIALLMIAKGDSKRLKNKNKLLYNGKPMFMWNIEKGISISKDFYLRNLQNAYAKLIKPRKNRNNNTHPINLLEDERQHRVGRIRHSMQMRPQSNVLTSQERSKTSRYADAAAVEHLAPPCSTTASTCALNCSTIPHETLPQIIASMLHEMLPLVNATSNATIITDEHHDDPRDVPMLHETRPQMLHDR
jgi:hypothetical protein